MFLVAKCDLCDYDRWIVSQPSYYKMGWKTIMVTSTYAWCDSCAAVTRVEDLETVAKWEEMLANVRAQSDVEFAARYGPTPPEWLDVRELRKTFIKEYENRVAWRRDRRSPAKCLECGSTSFRLATLEPEEGDFAFFVAHPGCGGTIRIGAGGFAQAANRYTYTPEGERIGGYGRPD